MKTNFLLLVFLALFCSCEVEGNLTKDPVKIIVDPITMPTVIEGQFEPTSGITVSGTAKVVQDGNSFKVLLDNFNISGGPDLKVYLSKTNSPSDFVNLGNLTTSTVYPIPANVSIATYKYVLIHCQQYNHLFAIAALK
jgi:hypothetical protein